MLYTLYIFYLKEIVYYLCYTSHACRRWSLMPVWLVVDLSGYPVPSMFVSVRKSVKHYRSLILHVKHDIIVTCICYTLSRTHCHIVKKKPQKQQQNPHNLYVIIETSVGLFMVQVIVKRQQ